jgi:glycerol-3-phosphate responsive antiterminator
VELTDRRLPARLVPVRDNVRRLPGEGEGVLLHTTTLTDVIRLDLDGVEGLEPSEAAIAFAVERLGIRILLSRRPALMARAAALGCLGLLRVSCLDSTGLERALDGHPGPPVGTAISPGLVLAHLPPDQRARLPRPLLAYGLVRRPEEAEGAVAAGADAVVVDLARESADKPLDTRTKRA